MLTESKKRARLLHRPLTLTHDQEQILCAFVRDACRTVNFVTPRALLRFIIILPGNYFQLQGVYIRK
jgi:hypothetical protein